MDEYDEDWEHRHRNEFGASSAEYGLLIGGIASLITVAVYAFGPTVAALFGLTVPGGG